MSIAFALAVGLALGRTCGDRDEMIVQPPGGYEAMQFNRVVDLKNFLARNDARLETGTILIHDRIERVSGQKLFCGVVSVNRTGLQAYCFSVRGDVLKAPFGRAVSVPAGSYARIRLPLE